MGKVATVWDGEVAGFRGALTMAPKNKSLLILSDSPAAISATRQVRRKGRARAKHLRWGADEISRRPKELRKEAVSLGWVKAYVGIYGNDELAKEGAEKIPNKTLITEGGLKQASVRKR